MARALLLAATMLHSHMNRLFGSTVLAVAMGAWTGISLSACDSTGEVREEFSCAQYCRQAEDCNDDVDVDECKDDCEDAVSDCQDDEKDATLDDLENCANESCNDFGACTIGAGLQCTFGI